MRRLTRPAKLRLLARLRAEREQRQREATGTPMLRSLAEDPARVMAWGRMPPDPWQADLLRNDHPETLILASRQAGKSQLASALALREALLPPPGQPALVLILSPTLRQSGELFRAKLLPLWRALGCPLKRRAPTRLELELANGSRIVSLPDNEQGIRGFSAVTLLVVDESARVDDDLYRAVRPMLATSGGGIVALSTPFGRRGWFHAAWTGNEPWRRVAVRATDCPRIPADFLATERLRLGLRWFEQEYNLAFNDSVDQLFSQDVIDAATGDYTPLF